MKSVCYEKDCSPLVQCLSISIDPGNSSDPADGAVPPDEAVVAAANHPDRRLLGQDSAAALLHGHQKCCPGNASRKVSCQSSGMKFKDLGPTAAFCFRPAHPLFEKLRIE